MQPGPSSTSESLTYEEWGRKHYSTEARIRLYEQLLHMSPTLVKIDINFIEQLAEATSELYRLKADYPEYQI